MTTSHVLAMPGGMWPETLSLPRWTKPWSRSQTSSTIGTSCASKPRGRVIMTSPQWRRARLRQKGKRCTRKLKRKLSTFWIQTQNSVPHLLSLRTGTVSKGFPDGPCPICGLRAEGALGNKVLVPQSVTLRLWSLLAGDLDHAGPCELVLHK